jgi:hypothetical protein
LKQSLSLTIATVAFAQSPQVRLLLLGVAGDVTEVRLYAAELRGVGSRRVRRDQFCGQSAISASFSLAMTLAALTFMVWPGYAVLHV